MAIGLASAAALLWLSTKMGVGEIGFAACWWIPTLIAVERAQFWAMSWVNRPTGGTPVSFGILDDLLYLDFNPREPVGRDAIVSGARTIWRASHVCAAGFGSLFLLGGLVLPDQPWMLFASAGLATRLAWDVYRRGLLLNDPAALVRDLCVGAFDRALEAENPPIWEWHAANLDLMRAPGDGSVGEFNAADVAYFYALTTGELDAAGHAIERCVALLPPEAGPLTQYLTLGDALFYYSVAAPEPNKSKLFAGRIRKIDWDLRAKEERIEAAVAIAEGRREDALAICGAGLDRVGGLEGSGGSARAQLVRRLLLQCQERLSRP